MGISGESIRVKTGTDSDRTDLAKSLLARAREMVPILATRAANAERTRSIPAETIADLKQAGFFRVIQPQRYGGYELDPGLFFDIQMTLAEGCMSTGWVYGVVAVHNWQLALFDPRAQERRLERGQFDPDRVELHAKGTGRAR